MLALSKSFFHSLASSGALKRAASRYGMRTPASFARREWFPYFMRRLGERPANVFFILRSLARER